MTEYYFDIETSDLDMWKEQVIAVAYQPMRFGGPAGDLSILRAWDRGGEGRVLREVMELGVLDSDRDHGFDFVPVGTNLSFDLTFLIARMDRLGIRKWSQREILDFFHDKATKDIKQPLVLMNDGEFRGSGLDSFSAIKKGRGAVVVGLWHRKDYAGIERYIREDAQAFFEVYGKIAPALADLGRKVRPASKAR